jgi:hypothetical protein
MRAAPALRPLGVGEMLDAAIKIYRRRPGPMVVATAVVVLPAIVLQTLVQMSAGSPERLSPDAESIDGGALATFLAGTLVSTVIVLVATNLALAGTTRISLSAYLGDEVGWRDSLRFAVRRILPLTALLAVTTLGLLAGTLLCLVPALWLQGIWAVAVPVLLVEDLGPLASLRRSQQLVRGRFWPVLGTLLVGGLLVSFLQGILVAPVIVLQVLEVDFVVTSVLTGLASFVGSALTTPLAAALAAVIYVDLRVRKEAYDLELMAGGLGTEVGDAPTDRPWAAAAPVPPAGGWGPPSGG